MADFRLGRLKFNWRGDWTGNTAYVIDDIVKFGANAYVCVTNHTSVAGEINWYSSDLSYWSLHTEGLTQKGDFQDGIFYKINDVFKYGNTQYRVTSGFSTVGFSTSANPVTEYFSGFEYEDTYNNSTQYQPGDVVTYGGYTYIAKDIVTGQIPPYYTDSWDILTTGFKAVGIWTSSQDYTQGDVVQYGGYSYVAISTSTNVRPDGVGNWDLIVKGINWAGGWSTHTEYKLGDAVNKDSNSYISIASTNIGNDPTSDSLGTYWNSLAEGAETNVLTTQGDIVTRSGAGPQRLGIGGDGQVLTVSPDGILNYEDNNTTHPVFYVTEEGSDTNDGANIQRSFKTIRHACGIATGPATIFVKAGVFEEILPITVPKLVSIVGDNIRTTTIKPGGVGIHTFVSGNAGALTAGGGGSGTFTAQAGTTYDPETGILIAEIGSHSLQIGHTITIADSGITFTCSMDNHATNHPYPRSTDPASGTAIRIDAVTATTVQLNVGHSKGKGDSTMQILTLAGAASTVSYGSTYANSLGTKVATALDSNYFENVITIDNVSGGKWTTSDIWSDPINGNINIDAVETRPNNEATMFQLSDMTMLKDLVMDGMVGFTTAGITTTLTGSISGTTLTGTNLFPDLVGTTVAGTGVSGGTSIINFIDSTSVEVSQSQTVSSTPLTFTALQSDINNAGVKGTFVRLNPASPITKSPYVSQCSAFSGPGGGSVGAIVDGKVHRHFLDDGPTPSNKSIVFDSFTNVTDNGVGFWVTNNGAAEFVSCFTYYAHISYAASRGGRIRALAGNSSFGNFGLVSSGFNAAENFLTGNIEGLIVQYQNDSLVGPGFNANEKIVGSASGTIGRITSVQGTDLYYQLVSGGPGVGTGFAQGETITGQISGTTAGLVTNTDANRGQSGFTLVLSGISSSVRPGGSIEFVTGLGNGGENNQQITGADPFTFVIQTVSTEGNATGVGTVFFNRAQFASTGAAHTGGTTHIIQYPLESTSTTLSSGISNVDTSIPLTSGTGFVIGEFAKIADELVKINSFSGSNTIVVDRSVEGSGPAATYSSGTPVVAIGASSVMGATELQKDLIVGVTTARVINTLGFGTNNYYKIDNEFLEVTGTAEDSQGLTTLILAEEKGTPCFDGQQIKVRYLYSQARFTGHDFLKIGTGGTVTSNWPAEPTQDPIPSYEITENFPGRVFYVSTDQEGNFRVGKYFRVNQATGSATLNASAFDLSGLTSLRLGSIGAQLGAQINEFSTDSTLSQNSNEKVPTQAAVKGYVDTEIASAVAAGNATTLENAKLFTERFAYFMSHST